ncbi:class I SAM-dependent methyltransferase [Anaeromyxobacter terrae]|uniref:class I SAM-dependent methyltransferase n=1 Tax=Anaeromyxobacter terrae TaxID=2925406 RepID=UPI001F5AEB3F|nr:class I SAM-dependent methyltransferase [Anaeromyxobacter sp. SG22]
MRGLEQIPWLYDLGLALLEHGQLGRWRAWLAGGARGRTLDLGTGTGRNLPLLPRGAAVAVDPHRANLARARRRAPQAPLVLARAEALPFRDGAFDTVLSGLVLCSVRDVPAALGEVQRVLAPGGTLRAIEHVRGDRAVGALQDRLQPAWTAITGGCHPNRETERALREAGLEIDAASREARGVMRRLEARPREGSLRTAPAGRHDP